jgi:hypothetical protein
MGELGNEMAQPLEQYIYLDEFSIFLTSQVDIYSPNVFISRPSPGSKFLGITPTPP